MDFAPIYRGVLAQHLVERTYGRQEQHRVDIVEEWGPCQALRS